MVLTGHLDDQPLPDLIRRLRVQRKSGRLQVEYTDTPGAFFFEDGQLVDAQLGSLRGLEAIYAALELQGASFNFNPLVRPPERSIDRQGQKFISDLVEVSRRENLAEIKIAGGASATPATIANSSQPAPLQLAPVSAELLAPLEVRLTAVEEAINATSRRFSRERLVYAVVISFLVGLTMVTALQALLDSPPPPASPATEAMLSNQKLDAANGPAANGSEAARATSVTPLNKEGEAAPPPPPPPPASVERENITTTAANANPNARVSGATKKAETLATKQAPTPKPTVGATTADARRDANASSASSGGYVVQVVMDVKNGKVTGARVLNPRPGADSYESLALRMARQRRYPVTFNGEDTLMLRVKP